MLRHDPVLYPGPVTGLVKEEEGRGNVRWRIVALMLSKIVFSKDNAKKEDKKENRTTQS